MEQEKDRLEKLDQTNGVKIAELETKLREAVKAMQATQESNDGLHKENHGLREGMQTAHSERDKAFKEVVRLTDELHSTVNERTLLNERNVQLAAEYAKAKEALRYFGINEKTEYKAKVPPHPLDGVILAVTEPNVVEISLGEDMGLRKGHKFEVARGGASSAASKSCGWSPIAPSAASCRKCSKAPCSEATRSMTNSTEDEPVAVYRKPRASVYTVMLVISLLAILVAILFLWLHLDDYKWMHKGGPTAALPRAASGALYAARS